MIMYLVAYRKGILVFSSREKQLEFYEGNQPGAGRMWSQPIDVSVNELDCYWYNQGNDSHFSK